MEHRLNDTQLLASLDAGHQSLPWDPGQPTGLLAPIDLRAIAESPEAAEIVPELPTQALYYALKQQSLEDVIDVLPFISQEQTERMVDYEAWQRDELIPRKMLQFISLFGESSPELMAERFSELDEEYQLACLNGKFKVYEAESIMDLPDELQERVSSMPCGKVFYEVVTDDLDEKTLIEKLLDASKEYNLRYAYSLISHASHMPPGESELFAQKFRKARMEEDGFVSFSESLELFLPFDSQLLAARWPQSEAWSAGAELASHEDEMSFLDRVFQHGQQSQVEIDALFRVYQGFLYLANAMCAATQTEADDVTGLQRLLEQAKALVNLGLETLAHGDPRRGLDILLQEPPKLLFRFGLARVDQLRSEVIQRLETLGLARVEHLAKAYHLRQWGRILLEIDRHWLDRIGLEAAETLKGLFNRFPMRPITLEGQERILFLPLVSRKDEQAFRHSLAVMLGYFAAVTRIGESSDRPFELILRDHTIAVLADGAQGTHARLEDDIPQLLQAWRDRLRTSAGEWMLSQEVSLEAVLDDVCSLMHEGLHGLIVLPRNPGNRSAMSDDGRML